jgi:hypothetical protein
MKMRNFIIAAMISLSFPALAADVEKDEFAAFKRKCTEDIQIAATAVAGITNCNILWLDHPGAVSIVNKSIACYESQAFDEDEFDDIGHQGIDKFEEVVNKIGLQKTCFYIKKKLDIEEKSLK